MKEVSKLFIAYTLLIVLSVFVVLGNLFKRKLMIGYGDMGFKEFINPKFWVLLTTNGYFLLVVAFGLTALILNLIVFNYITLQDVVVFTWVLTVPVFLLNLFLASIYLNEKINYAQYPYLGVLVLSMVISIFGIWGYVKNG